MKFIKNNAYIFVGTLLVLSLLTIIANSIYVGYNQYKLEGEPHMYGLMYVAPDGTKEYVTNTDRGNVSDDINQIAELAQHKTAVAKAKSLLSSGWLEEAGGEIFVIEIMKLAINPVQVTIPKGKAGYIVKHLSTDLTKKEPCYYHGPMNRDYYRQYDYGACLTPATRFKTEKKALDFIQLMINNIREEEDDDLKSFNRHSNGRPFTKDFETPVQRNDFLISTFGVIYVHGDD